MVILDAMSYWFMFFFFPKVKRLRQLTRQTGRGGLGLGVERSLHKRRDSTPAVRIPALDYDINRSELEIACRYSNSRAPGGRCAAYNIFKKSPLSPVLRTY